MCRKTFPTRSVVVWLSMCVVAKFDWLFVFKQSISQLFLTFLFFFLTSAGITARSELPAIGRGSPGCVGVMESSLATANAASLQHHPALFGRLPAYHAAARSVPYQAFYPCLSVLPNQFLHHLKSLILVKTKNYPIYVFCLQGILQVMRTLL